MFTECTEKTGPVLDFPAYNVAHLAQADQSEDFAGPSLVPAGERLRSNLVRSEVSRETSRELSRFWNADGAVRSGAGSESTRFSPIFDPIFSPTLNNAMGRQREQLLRPSWRKSLTAHSVIDHFRS